MWQVHGACKRKSRRPLSQDDYRQHVDVFYAFHDASYKPNARSFNIAREDVDHFLKKGTFLHGEWFTGGQRCPGGDHNIPLTEGLSERPMTAPDFPEYKVALEPTDGAPTQFANATNHHQTACWRTKVGITRRHAKVNSPLSLSTRRITTPQHTFCLSLVAARCQLCWTLSTSPQLLADCSMLSITASQAAMATQMCQPMRSMML